MTSLNNSDSPEMRERTVSGFSLSKVLGYGTFSTVYLGKNIETDEEFAIKVLLKGYALKGSKIEHAVREFQILGALGNPLKYFVHLHRTFEDTDRLYLVLTYAKNGDLLKYIKIHKKFNIECIRYYTAELVLALEYLHAKKIVHRDLKPENILFDDNFHILIADFGSAKIEKDEQTQANEDTERSIDVSSDQKYSFAGTAQFVSPEMLQASRSSYSSDLWALGCIVFQMASGQMPFVGVSEYVIFEKIVRLEYAFPDDFNETLKDLIEKLLVLDSSKRLGATDEVRYTSLRRHALFNGVNWEDLGPPPELSSTEITPSHNDSASETCEAERPSLDSKKASEQALDNTQPLPISTTQTSHKNFEVYRKISDMSPREIANRLRRQQKNPYSVFVDGNLILKQGVLFKGKGLFRRSKRMFLLTLGPHLYYVDQTTKCVKGEIPWSGDIRTEAKNLETFYIHTPNRKYHLRDPEGFCSEWIKAIDQVKEYYYPDSNSGSN